MRSRSQLANDAWESLLSAHARLMKEFLAEDMWDELSMKEYDVLYTLSKHPRPLRLGELNAHVLLSQPALSRLVDRLDKRGLLTRTDDISDRRGVLIELTAEGRAMQRLVGRRHARSVARALTASLTPEEMELFESLAGRLSATGSRKGG